MSSEMFSPMVALDGALVINMVAGRIGPAELVKQVPKPPVICQSDFDLVLKHRWNLAAIAGLFRYRLDRVQNKILPGRYGFVAQYNPEKSRPGWRRPCQDLRKVNVPFNPDLFNFGKISAKEVLFAPDELTGTKHSDTVLVINASPIEFGSSLLVPRVTRNIPQMATLEGLELLIRIFLASTDRRLKGGYSSPGGCSSVNHQHYHIYYLEEPLYLETAPVKQISGPCFTLRDYPSKGFAFQLEDDDPALLARRVFLLADYMRQNEMAHNLFITRGQKFDDASKDGHYETLRAYLWAREPAFGAKSESGMNPALCELAGHLLTTDAADYETMNEECVSKLFDNMTRPWFERLQPVIHEMFPDNFQEYIRAE